MLDGSGQIEQGMSEIHVKIHQSGQSRRNF